MAPNTILRVQLRAFRGKESDIIFNCDEKNFNKLGIAVMLMWLLLASYLSGVIVLAFFKKPHAEKAEERLKSREVSPIRPYLGGKVTINQLNKMKEKNHFANKHRTPIKHRLQKKGRFYPAKFKINASAFN